METKELKIQIPEGYEIDKENSSFEKIVFKKKENTKPRSWEEYCKNNEYKEVWYVNEDSNIGWCHLMYRPISKDKNTLPTKELAEAFLAMMQLMSLRQAWIGDWEPDWSNADKKWCIVFEECELNVEYFYSTSYPLFFQTEEMATDFMNTFKDLLEIAKPLI